MEATAALDVLEMCTEFTMFGVLMAVVRESAVFLDVSRCRLVQICGHLSGNCSLNLHGEDADSSVSKYEGCRQTLNTF